MTSEINVEYPGNMTLMNEVILKKMSAYKDDSNNPQNIDLFATGDVNVNCESGNSIRMNNDVIMNSNLVLNGTTYMNDANVFRVFDDDFTISYGFHINDNGILELYKHDSRVEKSTVVMQFGSGTITASYPSASESATSKISSILSRNPNASPNIFGNSLSKRQDI
jgi:hypothetical protein